MKLNYLQNNGSERAVGLETRQSNGPKHRANQKILIVSRSFYPMNSPRSFRTTELVKEFSRQGHDVTLLTIKNDSYHQPFEEKYNVTIKYLGDLKFQQISTQKGNSITKLLKRLVRRGLYQLFEYPDIELMWKVRRALRRESGYDLLITIAVPHTIHWGSAWARWQGNTVADTWIADCGDPYMGSNMDSFGKMFYFKYFEKSFCRRADFITIPIESAVEAYYPEFQDKIKIIPQGFKFDEVKINPSQYRSHDIPTFAYAGGLIPGKRDPRAFLDCLTALDMPYRFILYTRDKQLVEPYVGRGDGNIEIKDYIPRNELLITLSKMDFLVNFENSSPLMMPSKLIDYYITGRPVLNADSQGIDKEILLQFLRGDYSEKITFNGMDKYRIENVCRNFLELGEIDDAKPRK